MEGRFELSRYTEKVIRVGDGKMKKLWFIVMVMVVLMFAGCQGGKEPANETESVKENETDKGTETIEDGGVKDNTDEDAPKVIESTDIVKFNCTFSTLALEDSTPLDCGVYTLEATLDGDVVSGRYRFYERDGQVEDKSFEADSSYMDELQKVVKQYKLAEHNGLDVNVQGLPYMYGAYLKVNYASGEYISASDNQDNFLSLEGMTALENMFKEHILITPVVLDLTIQENYYSDQAYGKYLSVRFPSLSLGYLDWSGEIYYTEGNTALIDAIEEYNADVYKRNTDALDTMALAAGRLEGDIGLYSETEVHLTRNDDQYVSFYEHTTMCDNRSDNEYFWNTYNFDVKTGKKLGYADVFTNTNELASILADEFAKAYPALSFSDNMEDLIAESIQNEDGYVCFALSYNCVHVFAADYWLTGYSGGQHITLSYNDYPELVDDNYKTVPESWLLELEYGVDYEVDNGTGFNIDWREAGEMEVQWTANVNGYEYSELFYGRAPECYYVHINNKNYIYLQIPTGDISMVTNIYEMLPHGFVYLDTVEVAIHEETSRNPERICMCGNDFIYAGYMMMLPVGLYSINEKGLPVLEEGYGLNGEPVTLKKTIDVMEVDSNDASAVIGHATLEEYTQLTPFRTDKKSYIDFMGDYGKVYRFEVSDFSDQIYMVGHGLFEDLFE